MIAELNDNRKTASPGLRATIIIPCYNEEQAVLNTVLQVIEHSGAYSPFEIIVVDDGSTDQTPEILASVAGEHDQVTVLTHAKNRGYGASLKTGVEAASAPVIMITDADGTYPCDKLPELLSTMEEAGADMVVAARTGSAAKMSWLRQVPKFFMRRICEWITKADIPDMNSGLRAFKTEVVTAFLRYLPDGFSFTTTLTVACQVNGLSVLFVPINYYDRIGKSKIQPIRDTMRFAQLIIRAGIYFAPIRVFGPLAILLWAFFAAALAWDLISGNISDKTLLLLSFAFNVTLLTVIADMIHKK